MQKGRQTRDVEVEMSGEIVSSTGEVIPLRKGTATVKMPVHRRQQKSERWHQMFALVDVHAAAQLEMTEKESLVFWNIATAVNPNTGEARIRATEIAERLDMAPPNVYRVLKALQDRSIVIDTGASSWRLNPWVTFVGQAKDWEAETPSEPIPVWKRS